MHENKFKWLLFIDIFNLIFFLVVLYLYHFRICYTLHCKTIDSNLDNIFLYGIFTIFYFMVYFLFFIIKKNILIELSLFIIISLAQFFLNFAFFINNDMVFVPMIVLIVFRIYRWNNYLKEFQLNYTNKL